MPGIFILFAATLWGLLGPVSHFALQEGVTPVELAFWRGAIAGVLFFLHVLVSRSSFHIARRHWPAVVGFGIFGVAALEGSNLLAVHEGGSAFASILLYTAPAWVAIFSRIFFKERLDYWKGMALVLTLAGVAGVALSGNSGTGGAPSLHFSERAIFWGVISGLSYALFYLFGKKFFGIYRPQTLFMVAFPVGSLALFPFAGFENLEGRTAMAWSAIAFLGIASTWLAYWFYSLGLRKLDATRASILATLEPVVATGAAWLIWGEFLSIPGYFSAALVLTGVILMLRVSVTAR